MIIVSNERKFDVNPDSVEIFSKDGKRSLKLLYYAKHSVSYTDDSYEDNIYYLAAALRKSFVSREPSLVVSAVILNNVPRLAMNFYSEYYSKAVRAIQNSGLKSFKFQLGDKFFVEILNQPTRFCIAFPDVPPEWPPSDVHLWINPSYIHDESIHDTLVNVIREHNSDFKPETAKAIAQTLW